MSLIGDQQRKKAQVTTPTAKPIRGSALPQLEPDNTLPTDEAALAETEAAISADPQLVSPEQELPATPEGFQPTQQPTQPQVQQEETLDESSLDGSEEALMRLPDINLMPVAPVEIERAPGKTILPTAPIWSDTSLEYGRSANLRPEISNTTLPSFSVSIPDSSNILNSSFNSIRNTLSEQEKKAYAAAQRQQQQVTTRGALPNVPDATKRWYSGTTDFLGNVLFGTKRAQQLSEAGIPDLGAASFGRQGAGMGGAINYLLSTPGNLFFGAIGEANKATANVLQAIGVPKDKAEGFARDGFLTFLPDLQIESKAGLGFTNYKPSSVLGFNFENANKRNLLLDAIAGDPLSDINDPTGAEKYGRIFTRAQRKQGQTAFDDPVGLALQVTAALFNPGDIPVDNAISYGVGKLFSAFRKPAAVAAGEASKGGAIVLSRTPAEKATEELGQRAANARAQTAFRRATQAAQESGNVGFDLGNLTAEQARRLEFGTPRLNTATTNAPQLPPYPDLVPRIPFAEPLRTPEGSGMLDLGRLDVGTARIETPLLPGAVDEAGALVRASESGVDLGRLDYGVATVEYPTNAKLPQGANPSDVPRVFIGDRTITTQALPPAFDPNDIPTIDYTPLLPYSSPTKTALDIGIGNPNIRIENPGALAIRPLDEVIEAIQQVDSKLLNGFDGVTWEDFKYFVSPKLPDIGQVSAVGEDLVETIAKQRNRISFENYRQRVYDSWKTDDLTAQQINLYTPPEVGARKLLGESVMVEDLGGFTLSTVDAPPAALVENIRIAEDILFERGLKIPEKTNVVFVSEGTNLSSGIADFGGEWRQSDKLMVITDKGLTNEKSYQFTYLHEYAHKLDYYLRSTGTDGHKVLDDFAQQPIVKQYFPTYYSSQRRFRPSEVFAEAFASYLSEPQLMNQQYTVLMDRTLARIRALLPDSSVTMRAASDVPTSARGALGTQEIDALQSNRFINPSSVTRQPGLPEGTAGVSVGTPKPTQVNAQSPLEDKVRTLTESHINKHISGRLNDTSKHEILNIKLGVPDTDALQAWIFNIYGAHKDDLRKVIAKYAPSTATDEIIDELTNSFVKKTLSGSGADAGRTAALFEKHKFPDTDAFQRALNDDFFRDHADYLAEGYRKALTGEFVSRNPAGLTKAELSNPNIRVPTLDDLYTASQELSLHKLALDKPLQQLDELFQATVDFGRKNIDELPYNKITTEAALDIVTNEGNLKLVPRVLDNLDEATRAAWLSGDYEALDEIAKQSGRSFEQMLDTIVSKNNKYIDEAQRVRAFVPPKQTLAYVDSPTLYHGTALDNWSPTKDLYVNGSRGELGSGTYYTTRMGNAEDYATARVAENVNPQTMDFDVNPSVVEVANEFETTLDARAVLDKKTLTNLFADLPPEVKKPLIASINKKKKPISYVEARELMENALVKSGVEPTEVLLKQIDADISKNLRFAGYDSVYDDNSKFFLSLDNDRAPLVKRANVQAPTPMSSAAARYNADALAAKHYPKYLTTDANLRDSSYKALSQMQAGVDARLAEVQDEIISRGLKPQDTILPKVDVPTKGKPKPQSFTEVIDELLEGGVCSL